ncbi:gag-pol polyprotein [Cucumis melo var. makuwa]|uniref:Gag-pol polyprotein n=1 Tax=Cucumis melo var. makuwa TaxID=1194695 RepID=A0A5A7T5W8_CUCMM|nr:gag-pol polyprotein [Cucumis melo var. makuwa]TYJ96686.1 gag-pol polyprotein [Cucumis melo var. makuwa]
MEILSKRFTHAFRESLKSDIIEKSYSCIQVPKSEVDWTDAEEQTLVGNARALNAIFNDESISEYNERVLEIANESLLLGEKIPDSKIVRKVLRSLPRKFDMNVTANRGST